MKLLRMFTLMVVIIVLGVGCVTTKQLEPFPDQSSTTPVPGKARIYVMRDTGTFMGAAAPATVSDGSSKIGSMGVNGYLCWDREPGNAVICSTLSASTPAIKRVNCEADTTYFIRLRLQKWSGRLILLQEDANEGQRMLAKKKRPRLLTEAQTPSTQQQPSAE